MTVTMNAIGTTKGTTATTGVDAASPASTATAKSTASLLPSPGPGISTELLLSLLVDSASATHKIHSANRQMAAQSREVAQKEEVDKLHEEASQTLLTGVTTGFMQIGSAGLQAKAASAENDASLLKAEGGGAPMPDETIGAYKKAMDTAKNFKAAGDVNSALTGIDKAAGEARGKDLEADSKSAAARASSAKDAYDNETDAMHQQRDLKDAIIKAFDALAGVRAQNAGAFLAPSQRG